MATKAKMTPLNPPDTTHAPEVSIENLQAALQNTVNIANFFGSAIEAQSFKMDALNLPPKITLLWIIRNRKKFLEFITFVIQVIKEVKQKIQEIKDAQVPPSTPEG